MIRNLIYNCKVGNLHQDDRLITVNIVCLKKNDLGPGKAIKCILGLKGPIFILQSAANQH